MKNVKNPNMGLKLKYYVMKQRGTPIKLEYRDKTLRARFSVWYPVAGEPIWDFSKFEFREVFCERQLLIEKYNKSKHYEKPITIQYKKPGMKVWHTCNLDPSWEDGTEYRELPSELELLKERYYHQIAIGKPMVLQYKHKDDKDWLDVKETKNSGPIVSWPTYNDYREKPKDDLNEEVTNIVDDVKYDILINQIVLMMEYAKSLKTNKPIKIQCALKKKSTIYDDCLEPAWNWQSYYYRIKPEPEYRAFTDDELIDAFKSRDNYEIKHKKNGNVIEQENIRFMIIKHAIVIKVRGGIITKDTLLSDYTFSDGTPLGILKQEEKVTGFGL
jgi:hypothetical protein